MLIQFHNKNAIPFQYANRFPGGEEQQEQQQQQQRKNVIYSRHMAASIFVDNFNNWRSDYAARQTLRYRREDRSRSRLAGFYHTPQSPAMRVRESITNCPNHRRQQLFTIF